MMLETCFQHYVVTARDMFLWDHPNGSGHFLVMRNAIITVIGHRDDGYTVVIAGDRVGYTGEYKVLVYTSKILPVDEG